jgi:hypothetical protein
VRGDNDATSITVATHAKVSENFPNLPRRWRPLSTAPARVARSARFVILLHCVTGLFSMQLVPAVLPSVSVYRRLVITRLSRSASSSGSAGSAGGRSSRLTLQEPSTGHGLQCLRCGARLPVTGSGSKIDGTRILVPKTYPLRTGNKVVSKNPTYQEVAADS